MFYTMRTDGFFHWKLFFAIGNNLKEKRDFRVLQTYTFLFCPYVIFFSSLLPLSVLVGLFVWVFFGFFFTCCSVSEKRGVQFSKVQHS